MPAEFVEIYASGADQPGIARKLLDAAADRPEVVRTVSGGFRVPADVADAAGFSAGDPDAVDARATAGAALAQTAIDGDSPVADVLGGHAPTSLPAKVDGGPGHLTDQRIDGPADTDDRPAEVQVAAETGDVVAPDPRADGGGDVAELTGQALDDALEAAGLPKTGRADEKRARLAAHRARA